MPSPPSAAAAGRAAVRDFLKAQIGIGGTFTTLDLRQAIPGVNQIDRRMREHRQAVPIPWIIASSQSDRTLPQNTYRLDQVGSDKIPPKPSGRVRREVFEATSNRCQVCGIGVGEEYNEYPGEYARLQIGHWVPLDQGGSSIARGNLRAECHRCNGAIRNRTGAIATAASVRARVHALPGQQRRLLLSWLEQERRDVSDTERIFYEARQLPPAEQAGVIADLRGMVRGAENS